MDVAFPLGYEYQKVMNPGNYFGLLHWQWKASGDDSLHQRVLPFGESGRWSTPLDPAQGYGARADRRDAARWWRGVV
jgi:hypothetical protein